MGISPDSPAYRKLVTKGSNIRALLKLFAAADCAIRVATGSRFLVEKGSERLPALGGLTIEEVLRQVKGQNYSTYPQVNLDEHMRAVGVQWSEQEEAIVAAFQEWTRALATNTTPVASGGRSHRSVPAVDYAAMAAGRDQPPPARQENPAMVAHLLTGQLRVDMPAELGWIFNEQRLRVGRMGC